MLTQQYPDNTDSTLLKLFPGVLTSVGRSGKEVNNLAIDTVPQGTLLGSAMGPRERDRVFHVIDCNDERLYLCVCKAMPGEGYDAFAVIHDRARLGSDAAHEMLMRYEEKVADNYFHEIPKGAVPTIENGAAFVEISQTRTRENTPSL